MTLFRRQRRPEARSAADPGLRELYDRRNPVLSGGVYVSADTARRHSAVFACRDLISRVISTLPVGMYRKDADGARRPLPDPPLFLDPDGELDLTSWLYAVLDSLLGRGNAYGLILSYDRLGYPDKIRILNPDEVTHERVGRYGETVFKLAGKPIDRYPRGDLWHVPAYVVAGSAVGLSPIAYAAHTIGLGLNAEKFGADFFGEGAHPTGVLTTEQQINKESAQLIKKRFMDAVGKTREPAVLGAGLTYTPVQIAPEESQFLETLRANATMVARFFGVPASEIDAETGNSMTYANQEQRSIALKNFTLGPWATRMERALSALRPRGQRARFDFDEFLRSDTITRFRTHDVAIRSGMYSRDERRQVEEMPPIPDGSGDLYLWPPGRMQLDKPELELGADGDPSADDLPPEPAPAAPPPDDEEPSDDGT